MLRATLLVLSILPAFALAARADTISGHVVGPSASGIAGVDIDVFVQSTGQKLDTANDETGVGGSFSISVPSGTYRVGFDPSGTGGPTLAPAELQNVVVSGSVDVGDVALDFGIVVTGQVVGPTATGVAGVDLDVFDAATGDKLYTPNDNTDALGFFAFATSPGTYLVSVEPLVSTRLIAEELGPLAMSDDTNLGTIALEAGVWLSGRVSSATGAPIPGADVDAAFSGSGTPVALEGDETTSAGAYQVVVPTGTLDVSFSPPAGSALLGVTIADVPVSGDTVLDATLVPASSDPSPTTIALGDSFLGSLGAGDEVDEVRFEAVAGLLVSLAVKRSTGDARPDFLLLAPSGASVTLAPFSKGKASGVSAKRVPLPENGLYRLLAYSLNGGTGDYELRTKFKAPPELKSVPVAGEVLTPGATVDVVFVALPGTILGGTIASAGGGLDPAIADLLAPSGSPVPLAGLVTSQPGVSVSLAGVALPEAGAYTLQVGGASGSTGPFAGTLRLKFPKPAGMIVVET